MFVSFCYNYYVIEIVLRVLSFRTDIYVCTWANSVKQNQTAPKLALKSAVVLNVLDFSFYLFFWCIFCHGKRRSFLGNFVRRFNVVNCTYLESVISITDLVSQFAIAYFKPVYLAKMICFGFINEPIHEKTCFSIGADQ